MSCMESKFALRVEIKELKDCSYNDAYKYFVEILGEPDEIEEWEGEVEYFSYLEDKSEIVPVLNYSDNSWGADYILQYSYDGDIKVGKKLFTFKDLENATQTLVEKFNVSKDDVTVVNYEWYNGSDEPVKFK